MKPNAIYRMVHFIARAAFRLYGQWEIIGANALPKSGPVIIAPNHISYIDPPLVGAAVNRECAFMARHDLWNHRLLAWLLPRLGAFPVRRGEADRGAIRQSLETLARGLCLVMFPEGTRSRDGRLQAAELGVALIVQKSGAPVVPTAVIGSDRMLAPGASHLRRTPLKVVFGEPIRFASDSSRDQIAGEIMAGIASLQSLHDRDPGGPSAPGSSRIPPPVVTAAAQDPLGAAPGHESRETSTLASPTRRV